MIQHFYALWCDHPINYSNPLSLCKLITIISTIPLHSFLPPTLSPLATIPLVSVDNSFDKSFYICPLCGELEALCWNSRQCLGHRSIFFCGRVVILFVTFWGLRTRSLWTRARQWILGSGEEYASGLSHLYHAGPGPLAWTLLSRDAGEMCCEQSWRHRERQKECQAVSEPQKCQQSAECGGPETWHGTYLGSGKRSRQHAFSLPYLVSWGVSNHFFLSAYLLHTELGREGIFSWRVKVSGVLWILNGNWRLEPNHLTVERRKGKQV